jgi:membrane fusion protein, multidrug efflux system
MRVVRLLTLFAATVITASLAGCGDGKQQQQQAAPPPPQVTVAKPTQRTLVDQDEYVGRFVAVNSVEIRARVSGYLDRVHFKDGQIVKQGDLLFTIDKRPFENALEQTRANLAQARANLAYTEADLQRAQSLVRDRTITEQLFDQRTQANKTARAQAQAQEAAVKQAELDLQFTDLRSPITGRIGDRRVSPGNLVTGGLSGNTSMLATIVSIDPIRFEFTFDEASFLRYERLAKSLREGSEGDSTTVSLRLLDEKDFVHKGRMDFVDNVIDRSSGTIRGRAQFTNSDALFTPGMFARIRVPGSQPYQALLIPDAAIGTDQGRKFALVVQDDNTAVAKYLTLGHVVDDTLRVVKDGLSPDDRVIVNGLMRARAGQKVTPKEQGEDAPAKVSGSTQSTTR